MANAPARTTNRVRYLARKPFSWGRASMVNPGARRAEERRLGRYGDNGNSKPASTASDTACSISTIAVTSAPSVVELPCCAR